jgi:multiple sugar transport system permease protein
MATRIVRPVAIVLILLVVLYPLLWMAGTSLKSPKEIASNLSIIPKHVTWANFSHGWNSLPGITFGRFFLNSLMIAVAVVVANMASCVVTAYAFARLRFRFRGAFFAVMIGTLLLPSSTCCSGPCTGSTRRCRWWCLSCWPPRRSSSS